jgi:hypothetical protein
LRSEVHLVAPRDTVITVKRIATSIRKSRRAGRPDQANWITAAWLDMAGASVKSFLTSWKVPAAPATQSSQLLYLFNGAEPADASTIVQPVLQWGDSGPDEDGKNRTGPFWTAASWIVPAPDGHTYHTPHVRVSPGDTLVGAVTLIKKSAGGCTYACEFRGLAGTNFSTPPIPEPRRRHSRGRELIWGHISHREARRDAGERDRRYTSHGRGSRRHRNRPCGSPERLAMRTSLWYSAWKHPPISAGLRSRSSAG